MNPRSSLALLQKVICLSAHINMNQNTLMDTHTALDVNRERPRGAKGRRETTVKEVMRWKEHKRRPDQKVSVKLKRSVDHTKRREREASVKCQLALMRVSLNMAHLTK